MRLVILFPRPEVYAYAPNRSEFARALHAVLPWYCVRFLIDRPSRVVDALIGFLPQHPGGFEGVPPR